MSDPVHPVPPLRGRGRETTPSTTHMDGVGNMTNRPHALYRFFDGTRELLYIGITLNPGSRWKQHAAHKPWWHEVTNITVEPFPNRESVLAAERTAIGKERPRYNIALNQRPAARPSTPAERPEPTWPAEAMPDDCHDICVRVGVYGMYYPYRWRGGKAFYACVFGHRWSCWWGHSQSGNAAENREVNQLQREVS